MATLEDLIHNSLGGSGTIEDRLMQFLKADTQVVRVGKGLKYETAQAAVTAATAAGASVSKPYMVLVAPGVAHTYTPATGVTVLGMDDLSALTRRSGAARRSINAAPRSPWVVPYPSLIALRCDDGQVKNGTAGNWWTTGNAAFDGDSFGWAAGALSPLKYAELHAVPVTLLPFTDPIDAGDANFWSWAQLTEACRTAGFEIGAHAATAATHNIATGLIPLTTIQEEYRRQIASIENATIDGVAGHARIGLVCRGGAEPGPWDGANSITSTTVNTAQADWLRATFEWYMAYAYAIPHVGPGINPYFSESTFNIDSSTLPADIAPMLQHAATPGMRTTVLFHTLSTGATIRSDTYAALIKGCADLRAAGTCLPVTLTGLHQAQLTPPMYVGGTKLPVVWGGIVNGSMDFAGTPTTTPGALGWTWHTGTGNTIGLNIADGHNVPDMGDTNCLQMTADSVAVTPDAVAPYARTYFTAEGGHTYLLCYALKAIDGAGADGVLLSRKWAFDGSGTVYVNEPDIKAVAGAWTYYFTAATVPDTSTGGWFQWYLNTPASGTDTLLVDIVGLIQIG